MEVRKSPGRPALAYTERDRWKREVLRRWASREGCRLCGRRWGLTFHHPGEKRFTVGQVFTRGRSIVPWEEIKEEVLQRCVVLCSACHWCVHRTAQQEPLWPYRERARKLGINYVPMGCPRARRAPCDQGAP